MYTYTTYYTIHTYVLCSHIRMTDVDVHLDCPINSRSLLSILHLSTLHKLWPRVGTSPQHRLPTTIGDKTVNQGNMLLRYGM